MNWTTERAEIINALRERERKLDQLEKRLLGRVPLSSEGRLHVKVQRGIPRYFHYQNGRQTYLSMKNPDQKKLVEQMAQHEYDRIALTRIQQERDSIERALKELRHQTLESAFDNLPVGKQDLVSPLIPTPEQFSELWLNQNYRGKKLSAGDGAAVSMDDMDVRSRLEALVALRLEHYHVPVLYEYPAKVPALHPKLRVQSSDDYKRVRTDSTMTIYPDFAALNVRTGEVYYLEVFGMMDRPDYSEAALQKLQSYLLSDFADHVLYIFAETGKPLDLSYIDKLIEKYLL